MDNRSLTVIIVWTLGILVIECECMTTMITIPFPAFCTSMSDYRIVNCSDAQLLHLPRFAPYVRNKVILLYLRNNNLEHFDFYESFPNLHTLHAENAGIFRFESRLPSSLKVMNFAHNNISNSPPSFPPSMRYLDLSYNAITDMSTFSFISLHNALTILDVSYNAISATSLRYFSFPNSLEELSLEGNLLKSLDGIVWPNNLRVLNLRNNHLVSPPQKPDVAPRRLFPLAMQRLDLSYNKISNLSWWIDALAHSPKSTSLDDIVSRIWQVGLEGNAIPCDCHLNTAKSAMAQNGIVFLDDPMCYLTPPNNFSDSEKSLVPIVSWYSVCPKLSKLIPPVGIILLTTVPPKSPMISVTGVLVVISVMGFTSLGIVALIVVQCRRTGQKKVDPRFTSQSFSTVSTSGTTNGDNRLSQTQITADEGHSNATMISSLSFRHHSAPLTLSADSLAQVHMQRQSSADVSDAMTTSSTSNWGSCERQNLPLPQAPIGESIYEIPNSTRGQGTLDMDHETLYEPMFNRSVEGVPMEWKRKGTLGTTQADKRAEKYSSAPAFV